MTKKHGRISPKAALKHLAAADPVMAKIVKQVGRCALRPRAEGSHFDHVLRAIVYQQLSGKAAGTIHSRVLALFGGNPTPQQLLAAADDKLRAAGLSRQKLSYLKDLAAKAETGEVPLHVPGHIESLDDAAILEELTKVKGVGDWTAQMFLMFRLGRPDVLPTADLGINKAIMKAYGLRRMPKPKDVLRIGAAWSPHATIACWYLWRSLDLPSPRKPAPRARQSRRPTAPRKRQ